MKHFFLTLAMLACCVPAYAQDPKPPVINVVPDSNTDALNKAQDELYQAERTRNNVIDVLHYHRFVAFQNYQRASTTLAGQRPPLPIPVVSPLLPIPSDNAQASVPDAQVPHKPTPQPTAGRTGLRPASAGDPVGVLPLLTLPSTVAGDTSAYIGVTATTNGAEVRWVAIDVGLNVFPSQLLKTSTSTVVSSAKAGVYRLLAYTALDGIPSDPAVCTVVVGGGVPPAPMPVPVPVVPTPQPQPVPQPIPIPPVVVPPPPVAGQPVVVIMIDDALTRTPQTAALLADLAYWKSFPENVVQHFHIVPSQSDVAKQYTTQIAKAGGLPCVIIMSSPILVNGKPESKVLTAQRLPVDKVAMSALISQFTGK